MEKLYDMILLIHHLIYYLLHKIYAESDLVKAEDLKNEIILKYPETKFAKILSNSNNLILEKEIFIRKLDSFQNLFDQQKNQGFTDKKFQ